MTLISERERREIEAGGQLQYFTVEQISGVVADLRERYPSRTPPAGAKVFEQKLTAHAWTKIDDLEAYLVGRVAEESALEHFRRAKGEVLGLEDYQRELREQSSSHFYGYLKSKPFAVVVETFRPAKPRARGEGAGGRGEVKMQCPHPEHSDLNASASYNAASGRWRCHACGAKGDAVD